MAQSSKTKDILRRIVPWAIEKNAQQTRYRNNYKGNRGRIGIVGGARDYSGAPYFASISAMRLGADLAYVICSSTASQSIKNYSPDLIVTPLLDCPNEVEFQKEIECLMMRLHALVIGPGLGRDQFLLNRAISLIHKAKERSMPLIFDADSLHLVNDDPTIIKSYPNAILTPNRVELQRLCQSLFGEKEKIQFDLRNMIEQDIIELVKRCSLDLKVAILAKGTTDVICDRDGSILLTNPESGSNRRCGGQGDITAGLTAVYAHWIREANRISSSRSSDSNQEQTIEQPFLWAGYLAAQTTRKSNELAYEKFHNGMLCSDMIQTIPQSLDELLATRDDNSSCYLATAPLSGANGQKSTSNVKNARYKGSLSSEEINRYARHMIMSEFGPKCQTNLKESSALIIGAGGLGCPAAIYLAGAGIGRIGIVDNDRVELSNLHRQILHNTHKVGWLKTESIKQSLGDINPNVKVETHSFRLDRWNAVELIEQYDMVLDATDNLSARYMISDACVVAKRPLVSGAALKMCGQVTVYNYDKDTPCFRCLFPVPPPPNAVGSCSDNGVLGVLPGIIGVQQALEAIKLGAGLRPAYAGKMLLFDGELGQFRHITLSSRKQNCEACGPEAKLNRDLIDYEEFCSAALSCAKQTTTTTTKAQIHKQHEEPQKAENIHKSNDDLLSPDERISVEQYRDILESGRSHVLIDVRPREHSDVSRFEQALQIPLWELLRNDGEQTLSIISKALVAAKNTSTSSSSHQQQTKTSEIYVVCRRGIASQKATKKIKELLAQLNKQQQHHDGFGGGFHGGSVDVRDIIGGMTAWASRVDPSFACV